MASTIVHKTSTVADKVPLTTDLVLGEIAINTTDGKIFTKKADDTIVEVGTGGGGESGVVVDNTYPEVGVEKLTTKRHMINDKPVYTQVYILTIAATPDDVILATGLSGVDNAEVTSFHAETTNGYTMASSNSYLIADDSEMRVFAKTDGTELLLNISDGSTSFASMVVYVTIEYTKTADTTSSPIAGYPVIASADNTYPEVGVEKLSSKRHIVNDKPVYTQVIYIQMASSGTNDGDHATGLTGIDFSSVAGFIAFDANDVYTKTESDSYQITDTNEYRVQSRKDGTQIYISLSDDMPIANDSEWYVTLEYTKTADTNASPTAGLTLSASSGDTLQTAFVIQDTPGSSQTTSVGAIILTKDITPKSDDSSLIIEAEIPTIVGLNTILHFEVFLDGNATGSKVCLNQNSNGNFVKTNHKALIVNSSITTKTISIRVSQITGAPLLWGQGQQTLTITEIQN